MKVMTQFPILHLMMMVVVTKIAREKIEYKKKDENYMMVVVDVFT